MSFSYDNTLSTPLDEVRFNIQDTEEDTVDFSNEEINTTLTINNNLIYKTSRKLLLKLWMKYAKAPSKVEVDGVRIDNPKQGEMFKALYNSLESEEKKENMFSGKGDLIHFGGINRDTFNNLRDDDSLVRPRFTRQQVDWSPRYTESSPLDKDTILYQWWVRDE